MEGDVNMFFPGFVKRIREIARHSLPHKEVWCENCIKYAGLGKCRIGYQKDPIYSNIPIFDTIKCYEKNANNDCKEYDKSG